jgi:hypothetical protein
LERGRDGRWRHYKKNDEGRAKNNTETHIELSCAVKIQFQWEEGEVKNVYKATCRYSQKDHIVIHAFRGGKDI